MKLRYLMNWNINLLMKLNRNNEHKPLSPETTTKLKQDLIDLENDICFLERKKIQQPENAYRIDKLIFTHKKIQRSIKFELENGTD